METAITASQMDLDAQQLGLSNTEFMLETLDDVCAVTDALAMQARRSLLLVTDNLEPVIFDRQPFLDAVSGLARRHPNSFFRIMLQDGRQTVSHGHRLIELSRRLNSHIQIRRPAEHHRGRHRTFMVSDSVGYFNRPLPSRYEGTANFNDPGEVETLTKLFMEMWEHGSPDPEMQRLHI